MTTLQKSSIDQITKRIEKLNGRVNVGVSKFSQTKHLFVYITKKRSNDVCETLEIFCDVQINTKGNIVRGKLNYYSPIETKKDFY